MWSWALELPTIGAVTMLKVIPELPEAESARARRSSLRLAADCRGWRSRHLPLVASVRHRRAGRLSLGEPGEHLQKAGRSRPRTRRPQRLCVAG